MRVKPAVKRTGVPSSNVINPKHVLPRKEFETALPQELYKRLEVMWEKGGEFYPGMNCNIPKLQGIPKCSC